MQIIEDLFFVFYLRKWYIEVISTKRIREENVLMIKMKAHDLNNNQTFSATVSKVKNNYLKKKRQLFSFLVFSRD